VIAVFGTLLLAITLVPSAGTPVFCFWKSTAENYIQCLNVSKKRANPPTNNHHATTIFVPSSNDYFIMVTLISVDGSSA